MTSAGLHIIPSVEDDKLDEYPQISKGSIAPVDRPKMLDQNFFGEISQALDDENEGEAINALLELESKIEKGNIPMSELDFFGLFGKFMSVLEGSAPITVKCHLLLLIRKMCQESYAAVYRFAEENFVVVIFDLLASLEEDEDRRCFVELAADIFSASVQQSPNLVDEIINNASFNLFSEGFCSFVGDNIRVGQSILLLYFVLSKTKNKSELLLNTAFEIAKFIHNEFPYLYPRLFRLLMVLWEENKQAFFARGFLSNVALYSKCDVDNFRCLSEFCQFSCGVLTCGIEKIEKSYCEALDISTLIETSIRVVSSFDKYDGDQYYYFFNMLVTISETRKEEIFSHFMSLQNNFLAPVIYQSKKDVKEVYVRLVLILSEHVADSEIAEFFDEEDISSIMECVELFNEDDRSLARTLLQKWSNCGETDSFYPDDQFLEDIRLLI